MRRELLLPTGEEAGAGQPIYDRLAWGGMAVPSANGVASKAVWCKKRDRRPLSGTPISFLQGLFAAALFDEVREFLGKTRGRISS